jgi:hypothetical protein
MSRKSSKLSLLTVFAAIAACVIAIPALARTGHRRVAHKGALVLTSHYGARTRARTATAAMLTESATLARQGFSCEVTVGIGANGQTAKNYFVGDSQEFYIAYVQGGASLESVTTNCVGTLPHGTTAPTSIVSHQVACSQFQPIGAKTPTIQGYGISTTYPDGMYSETCNTPNFS